MDDQQDKRAKSEMYNEESEAPMDTEQQGLKDMSSVMKRKNRDDRDEIDYLRKEIVKMVQSYNNLVRDNNILRKRNSVFEDKLRKLERRMSGMEQEVHSTHRGINIIETKLDEIKENGRIGPPKK